MGSFEPPFFQEDTLRWGQPRNLFRPQPLKHMVIVRLSLDLKHAHLRLFCGSRFKTTIGGYPRSYVNVVTGIKLIYILYWAYHGQGRPLCRPNQCPRIGANASGAPSIIVAVPVVHFLV
jgi:hypothetical protein